MRWFGKAIGTALGMALGSYPGAVLGALLGHQFDQGLGDTRPGPLSRAQRTFFEVTFETMGHIAKVDGRVSEDEIRIARRIMHAMNLKPEQVRQAIRYFTSGKRADYPLRQRLADLAAGTGDRPELKRAFVEIQVQAAVGAGEIAESKRELLWVIARSLGVNRAELAQIEAMLRTQQTRQRSKDTALSLDDAYRSLGIDAGASDADVKTAYRRLMNQHHPDKLVSRGLPESMTAVAEERTQQIRAAYDRIRDVRGFR
jgi:DnaJ like chaperone protein